MPYSEQHLGPAQNRLPVDVVDGQERAQRDGLVGGMNVLVLHPQAAGSRDPLSRQIVSDVGESAYREGYRAAESALCAFLENLDGRKAGGELVRGPGLTLLDDGSPRPGQHPIDTLEARSQEVPGRLGAESWGEPDV